MRSFTDVMHDTELLGAMFRNQETGVLELGTWQKWLTVCRALFAESEQPGDLETLKALSGRDLWPTEAARSGTFICGRQSGKSRIAASIATFLGISENYLTQLAPGGKAVIAVLAADREQAGVLLNYIRAFFDAPLLKRMIVRETADGFELNNGAVIQVQTASFRKIRGRTYKAIIADEVAFWMIEGHNPASEIFAAARPGLMTLSGLLIKITTPYMETGPVYEDFKNHYGANDSRTLVVWAASREMNETLPQADIDAELEADYEKASAEYLKAWRSDLKAWLELSRIDANLIAPDVDRPRSEHSRPYRCFVDMSGGRNDSAALSIAHMEPDQDIVYVDVVRTWKPPFNAQAVVDEMADIMKSYGLSSCIGDFYGAEITRQLFTNAGINYTRSIDSASEIYLAVLPLFNTAKIVAPDNKTLRRELAGLIRRTRQSGRDQVTHQIGSHDDLANAACGGVLSAWRARTGDFSILETFEPSPFDSPDAEIACELIEARHPSPWGF